MRIKRVKIENFRCLESVEIHIDSTTTLIGPNGVGKSSVLRALDWFFNGNNALSDDDLCANHDNGRIRVEVEFGSLTPEDRDRLGRYAHPSVDTAVLWKTWENGQEKFSGKAKAFPDFEDVRKGENAAARRAAYRALREAKPDLELPAVTNDTEIADAMLAWERDNPGKLVDIELEGNNCFGFLGQAKFSGIFDFVLVTADLRAREETLDSKSAIIGRLLERSVDRTVADASLAKLNDELKSQQAEIVSQYFSETLKEISEKLSDAVGAFTSGRQIVVKTQEFETKPQRIQFEVRIKDRVAETNIERQGHGFQRTLLLSALKLLAESGNANDEKGVICLAIEEPELYQHPAQAKAFATVLRQLADSDSLNMQVMYATHNPIFIDPRRFEQVRRLVRVSNGDGNSSVNVFSVTKANVEARLVGLLSPDKIQKNIESECLRRLSLALFADVIVLVEGDTERAIIEGAADRAGTLHRENIAVAEVGGKDKLLLSRALLEEFGIPSVIVADTDSGVRNRMERDGRDETRIVSAENQQKALNRKLLRLVGQTEVDWPIPGQYGDLFFIEDTLETMLMSKWPSWESERQQLIQSGNGYDKKHSLTYYEAAINAPDDPPVELQAVIDAARGKL